MRKIKLNKPLVESSTPPSSTNVYWVDIDESTGNVKSIKSFNTVTNSWESTMLSSDALKFNGITYNEELNSVSVGTKTSSKGQDQLVFGKYNAYDADKAEVVGGGFEGYVSDEYNPGDDISYVTGKWVQIQTDTGLYYGGNTYSQLREALYVSQSLEEDVTININQNDPYIYFATFFISCKIPQSYQTSKRSLRVLARDYNGVWYEATCLLNGYQQLGPGGVINDITVGTFEPWENVIASAKQSAEATYQALAKEKIFQHNIRTLDWEGTQWNAGDITCDDGNGNTISMRDLLSRIQALENV